MVFDENGDVIYRNKVEPFPLSQNEPRMTLSVGERLFTWQDASLYLETTDTR